MVDERVTGCDEALLTAVGESQLDYRKAACGELLQRCTGAGPTERLIRFAPITGVRTPSLSVTAIETPSLTTGLGCYEKLSITTTSRHWDHLPDCGHWVIRILHIGRILGIMEGRHDARRRAKALGFKH